LAQFLAGAAVATAKEVGGGTVTSIILAGEILRKCGALIKKGIHPTVIQEGCTETLDSVLKILDESAIPIDLEDRDIVRHVFETSLTSGSVSGFRDLMANMVLRITELVDRKDLGSALRNIEVKRVVGGWFGDSRLVRGCTFYREPTHADMPESVENAKIAILKGGLKIPERGRTRHLDHKVLIEDPHGYQEWTRQRIQLLKDMVDRIVSTGANVLLVEKGIDDAAICHLARRGLLTIRRFPPPELERVAEATGGAPVSDVETLEQKDLGEAKRVYLERIAGEPWWFLEDCRNPRIMELLLRGANTQLLGEAERAMKNAFKTLSVLYGDARITVGGGAVEMEIAQQLRERSRRIPAKKQLVVEAVADAFEAIACALIQTTGLDPLDVLPTLRAEHARGARRVGFDVHERRVKDMLVGRVVEPVGVKIQEITAAFEAAYTILRIDDFVVCRQLPKPEADYTRRVKGTAPRRVKEIREEYGLEW
jgi:chaperonin GroEL (HSP60 family)